MNLPLVFLLIAAPVLLSLAVLIPPGYAPDEADHAARAESLTHGAILGGRGAAPDRDSGAGPVSGVRADQAIVAADTGIEPGAPKVFTRADLRRLLSVKWTGTAGFVSSSVAPYFPVFYVPEAAAMGAARLVGAPPLAAIFAGRFANVGVYLVLGAAALALAARGAGLIFVALTMPMSLWLAASLNQDGLLIATACLGCALMTRASVAGGHARWGALALMCVMLAKPPYLPLALLMVLPLSPNAAAAPLMRRALMAAAIAVPVLVWAALAMAFVAAPVPLAPYHPGPLFAGDRSVLLHGTDAAAQIRVLLHPFWQMVSVPMGSFIGQFPGKLQQMVGGVGKLDVRLPWPITVAWLGAIAAAAGAATVDGESTRNVWDRWGMALAATAILACVFMLYVTLYLSWTAVGLDHVEGVQGRYFIPLLPFLVFALPPRAARPAWAAGLAMPAMMLAATSVAYLPLLAVAWFYFR